MKLTDEEKAAIEKEFYALWKNRERNREDFRKYTESNSRFMADYCEQSIMQESCMLFEIGRVLWVLGYSPYVHMKKGVEVCEIREHESLTEREKRKIAQQI